MMEPTLLIGLGGTGARIVDQVYAMLAPEQRQAVAAHAFDTDINDLEKLSSLKGHLTQTSDNITVRQCRQLCGPSVDAWFSLPADSHGQGPLDRKLLTKGAGQIRMVSRLALYYTMKHHGLDKLEKDIARLFQVDGAEHRKSVRVFIVSTLAGGTGAGIFLQTALFIRHLLTTAFHQRAVFVRGLFLLPDIFIQSGVTRPDESVDLRANAYASLKELNGIIRSISDNKGQSTTIELEYMPNQQALAVSMKPYDSCFLLDYENSEGKNLGSGGLALRRYEEQAAKILQVQLASPIGEENESNEDNLIRKALARNGLNLYGSAGVARLCYPAEAMLAYCAGRMVQESIRGQWLRLDELFAEELKEYDRAISQGELREQPARNEFFTTQLAALGGPGDFHPFFTPLYRSTRVAAQDQTQTAQQPAKAQLFLEAVQAKIDHSLSQNRRYQEYLEALRGMPTDKKLLDRREVKREVQATEDALRALKDFSLRILIPETVNPLLYAVMREDAGKERGLAGREDFRLNAWILIKNDPMHPVAIRFFLYDLELRLARELATLSARNHDLRKALDAYDTIYDLDDTEVVEDAEARVREALKQGAVYALISANKLKDFAVEYQEKASLMQSNVRHFARSKIMEEVYQRLLTAIRALSGRWEIFFASLAEEQRALDKEVLLLSQAHERKTDPTLMAVKASASDKEALWHSLRANQQSASNGLGLLWERLYCHVYDSFSAAHWQQQGLAKTPSAKDAAAASIIPQLLQWSRRQLAEQPQLHSNLMQALGEEASAVERIQECGRRAQVWISKPMQGSRQLSYWGLHPDNMRQLSEEAQGRAFGEDHVIVSETFRPDELICYRAMYGLTAETLSKFNAGGDEAGGLYFQAYQKARESYLHDGAKSSHHLDRNWHLPAYLPDLNEEFAKIHEEDRKSAFIYGLVGGKLKCRVSDRREIWRFYSITQSSRDVLVNGQPVAKGYYRLFEALNYNPGLVDEINQQAERELEADCQQHGQDFSQHRFIQGCAQADEGKTIVDVLLLLAEEIQRHENAEQIEWSLMDTCLGLIIHHYRLCHGPKRLQSATEDAKAGIKTLLAQSQQVRRMDEQGREHWLRELRGRMQALLAKSGA